ncbi:hypothetical protein IMZ48_04235 [Candidatus Bathyarchaeota archaeon]|nr:hypothetical protein [Candidatus Bathyarchaeota archaeon]
MFTTITRTEQESAIMEALGVAANVCAVVDMSAKVISLCSWYFKGVVKARKQISRLQNRVSHLQAVLENAKRIIEGPDGDKLAASREIADCLAECVKWLEELQKKLEPSGKRKAMRLIGLRALRWPLRGGEIEGAIACLERCENTIAFGLQIDQT